MSKREPDQSLEQTQQAPFVRERKPARKPGRDANEVFRVSEDGEDEPEFLIQLPVHVDVRKFVKRNYGGGDYLIKNKIGGKFKGERELHIEFAADENVSGEAESSFDDVEQFEPTTPNALDATSLTKLVAATVNATLDARERTRRAEQAQPSVVDIMREQREQDRVTRAEMREEMRAMLPKQDSGDAFDKFLKMFDRAAEIQERMTPPATSNPNATTFDKILGVASEVARAAPQILPQLAGMAALQQTSARREPQAAPTMGEVQRVSSPQENVAAPVQQTEGSEAAMTIDVLITNIVNDVQHDEAPDDCVDDVVRLATEDPKWQPALAQILELPNVEILQTLKDAKGVDLSPLNNAGKFLDGLRKGVKARIKLQAPPTAQAAASNGNGTVASLKTA